MNRKKRRQFIDIPRYTVPILRPHAKVRKRFGVSRRDRALPPRVSRFVERVETSDAPSYSVIGRLLTMGLLTAFAAVGCSGASEAPPSATEAKPASRWSHQDWPTGHYKVVEGWPKPLPDTRHSHAGMDMGILRRSLRREPGPNLGCHAR